ncbi:MAG: hypothetical protein IJT04_03980 [Bacteroidales bacterium]|nr:hypothetical protein [Bacteroidales bacterium]
MTTVWWENLLDKGYLKDNQSYIVSGTVSEGNVINSSFSENSYTLMLYYGKNHIEDFYDYLVKCSSFINNELEKSELFLFNNKEYEHNTSDNICSIEGYYCNKIDFNKFVIHTGNVVGSVKIDGKRLTISSRFGDRFLKYIISDADGFLEIKDNGAVKDDENSFKWLLLYLWKVKLQKAYRLGIPKSYTSQQSILTKFRGNVDLVHYELNKDLAKFLCNYKEHSYNNSTTQLIAAVINKNKNHEFLTSMRSISNAFITAVDGFIPKRIRQLNEVKHFSNPYYSDYNIVIDLSKKLLRDESLDFGDNNRFSGFLFDVSMLFEYFIRKQLSSIHGIELFGKSGKELTIPTCGNKQEMKLKPDLIFQIGEATCVFDVKYKRYDPIFGVKREDLFQMHTYVGRYANQVKNIAACGFIYPLEEKRYNELKSIYPSLFSDNHTIKDKILVSHKEIDFFVVFLLIPEDNNNFVEKFHKSCENFRKDMAQNLNIY